MSDDHEMSSGSQAVDNPIRRCKGCERALNQFAQQNLPACKPVLTPASVISMFLVVGMAFIPPGIITLRASQKVIEVVERYDAGCVPPEYRNNKVWHAFKTVRYPKTVPEQSRDCAMKLRFHRNSYTSRENKKVEKHTKAPIFIYYQLDNYYQNHRRYAKSRSDKQLLQGLNYNKTSSCKPEESSNGLLTVPCGLIAWSLFNDSYAFSRGMQELQVNRKDISWKSDQDHKFGKEEYPLNFQNETFIRRGALDPNIPPRDQEDLLAWMHTATLPTFRKLYGTIKEDLKLVLSTLSWFGGKNDFLRVAYIFIRCSSI